LLLNVPFQITAPFTVPENPAGTGKANPLRKISSLPESGTVVIHVFVMESNVVEAHEALGEKVICALGTAKSAFRPGMEIVELVNVIVAPVLGIPLAVKFELNQI